MKRVASGLRWLADWIDGGDYYCEHWTLVRGADGRQQAVWHDALPVPGQAVGLPLYSRKDEQHLEEYVK